jgi:magnesium-protoporphyrin IX monomethyl ester (oxidative) cyclase
VFTKTSTLTKQIFPITLDIDNPRWQRGLEKLQKVNVDLAKASAGSGPVAWLKGMSARARAAAHFVGLFTIPVKKHTVPASPRLEPAY